MRIFVAAILPKQQLTYYSMSKSKKSKFTSFTAVWCINYSSSKSDPVIKKQMCYTMQLAYDVSIELELLGNYVRSIERFDAICNF